MATTTFSSCGTVDGSEQGNRTTRRGFLRWVGSVAAAGALAAVDANGRGESAQAKRHGKKRHKRHADQQPVSTRAIDTSGLEPDQGDGDLSYAGTWCHWQIVCYPNRGCRRRRVCW